MGMATTDLDPLLSSKENEHADAKENKNYPNGWITPTPF